LLADSQRNGMTGFVGPGPIASIPGVAAHLGADWTRSAALYVYPGEVGVRLQKYIFIRPEDGMFIRQVGGTVQLNIARLPPWFDTATFIDGGSQQCVVGFGRWHRRRLLAAIARAGLEVRIVRRTIFTLYMR
jgi:hypothetical protein